MVHWLCEPYKGRAVSFRVPVSVTRTVSFWSSAVCYRPVQLRSTGWCRGEAGAVNNGLTDVSVYHPGFLALRPKTPFWFAVPAPPEKYNTEGQRCMSPLPLVTGGDTYLIWNMKSLMRAPRWYAGVQTGFQGYRNERYTCHLALSHDAEEWFHRLVFSFGQAASPKQSASFYYYEGIRAYT